MTLSREIADSLILIGLVAVTSGVVLGAGLLFGWVLG
jgi:hypothetical protein